ncbi:MAG: hypothetical protein U1F56_25155 [Rubrivivax sp.]
MPQPTPVSVSVTVVTNAAGQPCVQAAPDALDLSNTKGAVKISWTLATAGYRFLLRSEDSTFGIDISGTSAGSNFTGWNANNPQTPTEVDCTEPNNDGNTYTYTITVKNLSTGASVVSDPSIKDNSSK